MINLEELVNQIKRGNFNPLSVSTPDLFLRKHENLMLIEHLVAQEHVNLILVKNTLSRYALLLNNEHELDTHLLAFAQSIRIMCMHIIRTHSLDIIATINESIATYFPFLSENSSNSRWLPQFLKDTDMLETIYQLLTHTSYRIKIGQMATQYQTIATIAGYADTLNPTLNAMALHRLYTTHRNQAIGGLNALTAKASSIMQQVPVLCSIQSNFHALATKAGYDARTETGRTKRIKCYKDLVKKLESTYLCGNQDEKKAHIELLTSMYLEGSCNLRSTIVDKLNLLIDMHSEDKAFLVNILKTIAPEPLGEMKYGMQANPTNLLGALSEKSSKHLLNAYMSSLREDDDAGYTDADQHLNFNGAHIQSARWQAYLLCMGNFPTVKTVTIKYDEINYHDHMLISYLMGSPKLILSSANPIYEILFSPLPVQCVFKSSNQSFSHHCITQMATRALDQGLSGIKFECEATDKEICTLINNAAMFTNAASEAQVYFKATILKENSRKNTTIDFTLSRTEIRPGALTTGNEENTAELIRLFIMAYASQNVDNSVDNHFVRPIAIPSTEISNPEKLAAIKQHTGQRWILVYDAADNNKFLYDIELVRYELSGSTQVKRGYFIKLDHGDLEKYRAQLPTIKKNPTSSTTAPVINSPSRNTTTQTLSENKNKQPVSISHT